MDEQNQQVSPAPIYQESQDKNAKWLWLLIFLIIIGAVVFAFFRGIGPFESISPFAKKTASPTPSASPVAVSSPITEPSPSTENLDRKDVSIRVVNGSGVSGKAASVRDFLEELGWKVASIGNADGDDYKTTEVRFKADSKKFESLIIEDLSSDYDASASTDNLDASDSADIEVIVGTK